MEKLEQRKKSLSLALDRFHEAIDMFGGLEEGSMYFQGMRDSVIQRFEFSIDAFWKYLAEYVVVNFGVTPSPAPYAVLREAAQLEIITKQEYDEIAVIIKDRNITSHTYDERLAQSICDRSSDHYEAMISVFERLQKS